MKRIACNVMFLASVLVMLLSCDSNVAKKTLLKMDVEKMQKELPISLGSVGNLTGITYDDDVVTISSVMNENMFDIGVLAADSNLIRENFQCMVARNNGMQKMVKQISEAGASLVLKYKGKTSGKEASLTITKEELSNTDKFILTGVDAAEKYVDNSLRMERKRMPMDVGNGIKMIDSFWEGDNLVYLSSLDKHIYSVEGFRNADKGAMKQGVLAMLSNETASQSFIEALVTMRRNIIYRYQVEDSNEHIDIVISNSDLKNVLGRFGKK